VLTRRRCSLPMNGVSPLRLSAFAQRCKAEFCVRPTRRCREFVIARSEATKQSRSWCTKPLDCFADARNDGHEFSRSRDAFFAPEFCQATARKLLPPKNKGRRSAERRNGSLRTGTSDERIRVRGQCGERHGRAALPRTSACGRPRLSALRRGTRWVLPQLSFGLRIPGGPNGFRRCKTAG
jgi:hypothetical protein